MAYIPEEHKKYKLLPFKRNKGEVFEYPDLTFIENLLEGYPVQLIPYHFFSYEEYFNNLDEIDACYSRRIIGLHKALEKLRKEMIRLNKKEEWSICKYIGKSTDDAFGLKHNHCYYWPTTKDNPEYHGVIDDEEFTSYFYFLNKEDWEILEDPTGMAHKAIETDMDLPGKIVPKDLWESILNENQKQEKLLESLEHISESNIFEGYSNFDLQIKHACELFYNKHNVLPNVIYISDNTYNKIMAVITGNKKASNNSKWNKYIEKDPDVEVFFGNYKGEDYSYFEYGKDIKLAVLDNEELNKNEFVLTSRYIYDFEPEYLSETKPKYKKDEDGFPIIKASQLLVLKINELSDGSAIIQATNGDYTPIYFKDLNYVLHKEKFIIGKLCVVRLVAEIDKIKFARTYKNKSHGEYNETKNISETGIYEFKTQVISPYYFDKEDLSNGKENGIFIEAPFYDDEVSSYPTVLYEAVLKDESYADDFFKDLSFIQGTLTFVVYENIFDSFHKYGKWYKYWGENTEIKYKRFSNLEEIKRFFKQQRKNPITCFVELDTENVIDIDKMLK